MERRCLVDRRSLYVGRGALVGKLMMRIRAVALHGDWLVGL